MFTFSCAVQKVEADGTSVQFEIDPNDHAVCLLHVGNTVLRFQRNGNFLGAVKPEAVPVEEKAPAPKGATWGRRKHTSED